VDDRHHTDMRETGDARLQGRLQLLRAACARTSSPRNLSASASVACRALSSS
jgi:hypothetical protein